MARLRRRLTRIQKIMRRGVFLLCAALAVVALVYHYRPDLFALAGPEGQETPPEMTEPDGEPQSQGQNEKPQLDAPEAGEPEENPQLDAPETGPPPPQNNSFEPVDGNSLWALVTKQTTLGRYAPSDLEPIPAEMVHPDRRDGKYYLRREALEHLQEMWAEARDLDGVVLTVTSAYRSYDTQVSTFNYWAAKDGEAKANTYSARAGQSEHQLGTTLDFNIDTGAGAEQHAWLAQKAHHYGFAMSYPESCQEITGYKYEPWHYRYIGVAAAEEWKASGLPLCTYLEQKQ